MMVVSQWISNACRLVCRVSKLVNHLLSRDPKEARGKQIVWLTYFSNVFRIPCLALAQRSNTTTRTTTSFPAPENLSSVEIFTRVKFVTKTPVRANFTPIKLVAKRCLVNVLLLSGAFTNHISKVWPISFLKPPSLQTTGWSKRFWVRHLFEFRKMH